MRNFLLGAIFGVFGSAWFFGALPKPLENLLTEKLCYVAPIVCADPDGLVQSDGFARMTEPDAVAVDECLDKRLAGGPGSSRSGSSGSESARLRPPSTGSGVRPELLGGTIRSNLYTAAINANIPAAVVMNVAGIFSHTVDFQRDLRTGDEFEILFIRRTSKDRGEREGSTIEFASLTVQGHRRDYYRFKTTDDDRFDFYDTEGQSAGQFLMRTPVNGARISSYFGLRKHPVLGYTKEHRGTDFAAPSGTPVFATGDGIVERSGRFGSYGKYIRIHHSDGYKTAYAHLSGYRKGVEPGIRVRQGQVIGFVGATGRVTGPHLHYEVILDNRRIDPRSVQVRGGRKLDGEILQTFKQEVARIDQVRSRQPDWRVASVEFMGSQS